MKLFIRKETKLNEYRTPLIPSDCKKLIDKGFKIIVESSDCRCFSDEEYKSSGCIISNYEEGYLVVGLKELGDDFYYGCRNMYFSHSFKGQMNSGEILGRFRESGGVIYDYEYIVGEDGRRSIAFGFWAGFVGCFLGLYQFKYGNLSNLRYWGNYMDLLDELGDIQLGIKIGIIGINGRCGGGCKYLLDLLKIGYKGYCRDDKLDSSHDILINCIYLSPDSGVVFIDDNNVDSVRVLVDVSCDIYAENNPIRIEYPLTNYDRPVYRYRNTDIIAIDNLPSLLPRDSSEEFSNKLVDLLNEETLNKLECIYRDKLLDYCW